MQSKSSHPVVSILIPAYNAGKYIAEAITSALDQTYPYKEIIVVDDASTDDTYTIAQSFVSRGIKLLKQEKNKGQCAAANTAYNHSTGELIKFLDADDILSPENISLQVENLNGDFTNIASSMWGRFYNDDLATFRLNPEPVWKDMKPIDWLVASLKNGQNMMQCGIWLIPRAILEKSGLWNEKLSLINDFDFMIRVLLQANEIKFTPNATLYYRSGMSNSLSQRVSRKAFESAYLSTELGTKTILAFEDSDRTRKVCADCFQNWAYRFYPTHKDLYRAAISKVKQYGGSDCELPAGHFTKGFAKLIGWQNAFLMRTYFNLLLSRS